MSSLVLYAEGECQAWFLENSVDSTVAQILPIIDSQAICLQNVYLVDGCLTSTLQFNGSYGYKNPMKKRLLIGQWKICCVILPVRTLDQTARI
ncbi:unnamed protein product [Brassica rapa]|uniref:Uncharacterized protein n=1 Tax=Brassica campestris TaxID=3711 RepID=A0A3P6B2S7_BRACM|nr:unnamed protein product [Brassica rapa]VDC96455.1 unnamed protein product [Brassica rapa]